jgi:hypothetical protein
MALSPSPLSPDIKEKSFLFTQSEERLKRGEKEVQYMKTQPKI